MTQNLIIADGAGDIADGVDGATELEAEDVAAGFGT